MSTLLQQRHPPITAPKLRDRGPAQPPTPGLQPAIPGSQLAIPGSQLAMPRASARHAVPAHPVVAPRASWSLMLGLIVAALREWRRRHVARYELASLDERTLRDIGLDPGVVDYEVRQSFWRSPRDWRD
jgi:uncharacterized protein YjiS (DUF1127 family)